MSKETTHRELCKVKDVPEIVQRMQGINLSGGATNAVEFACAMYSLPTMETMLKSLENEIDVIEEVELRMAA
jgi:hypothetical protein